MKKKEQSYLKPLVVFFVFLVIFTQPAQANEEQGKIKTSTNIEVLISTQPEAKIRFIQSFIFPFLQGSGPLTTDNNITALVSADVTPISLLGMGEIIWKPAAFFLLSGGSQAGSGWNIPIANGIGINAPKYKSALRNRLPRETNAYLPPRKAKIYGGHLDGLVWSAWGAGTLQFDLGEIIPGDWTHVLFQTRQELRYSAYTQAGPGDSWVFENDDGENQNGWKYHANFLLGYSMPQSPVLNTIGIIAELDKTLYNTPGGDFWGEHLEKWIFSGISKFSINPWFSTALVIQMRTRRNHGTRNFNNNNDYYYQDLKLESDEGQRRFLFYRAAVILNFKIR